MDERRERSEALGVPEDASRCRALSRVQMLDTTARLVQANTLKKGDVLSAARFAAIQSAQEAARYLPLFDPVVTRDIVVDFEVGTDFIEVVVDLPGEGLDASMPALTGATVAALTIFDMCKAVDRTMCIGPVRLEQLSN